MMIIVSGVFFIQADKRDGAIEAMRAMAAETAKEAGCIQYDFSADLTDATKFYVYEEWETLEHLDAHGQTPHMATFRGQIPNFIAAPPVVNRFEASPLS